mgnify:CR=1 FL=1
MCSSDLESKQESQTEDLKGATTCVRHGLIRVDAPLHTGSNRQRHSGASQEQECRGRQTGNEDRDRPGVPGPVGDPGPRVDNVCLDHDEDRESSEPIEVCEAVQHRGGIPVARSTRAPLSPCNRRVKSSDQPAVTGACGRDDFEPEPNRLFSANQASGNATSEYVRKCPNGLSGPQDSVAS